MAPPAAATAQLGDRAGFLAEARNQGKCAVTKATGVPWHPHHVVYEKHLEKEGAPIYDARNVLRVSENAHANHHSGARRIRVTELLNANIDYACYLMGTWRAIYYLRRYYDDTTEPDPRLARIQREQEQAGG